MTPLRSAFLLEQCTHPEENRESHCFNFMDASKVWDSLLDRLSSNLLKINPCLESLQTLTIYCVQAEINPHFLSEPFLLFHTLSYSMTFLSTYCCLSMHVFAFHCFQEIIVELLLWTMLCIEWKKHTDSKTSIVVPPSDSQPIGDVGTNLFHHKHLRRKTNAVERSPGWAMRGHRRSQSILRIWAASIVEVAFDRRWRGLAETS